MARDSLRDSSLVRMWRRRHAHGWASVMYEYADGLYAGVALPPADADRADPVAVVLFYEHGPSAMIHADQEVSRLSGHQCTADCGRWAQVAINPSR